MSRMTGGSVAVQAVQAGRGRALEIAVLGAGYVGLVTAACLTRLGHRVVVVETDPHRLAALEEGNVPFSEPMLDDLVAEGLASRALRVTGDPADALPGADAILICVGTPLAADGTADLTQVRSACAAISTHAPLTPVVVRSTLPPGVAESLAIWLGRTDQRTIVVNPEFLRQSTAVHDFLAPTRIVIGTADGAPCAVSRLVERIYAQTAAPVLVTDYASAIIIKNAANAYLATRLTFINEVADLCEAYGADIDLVRQGLSLDPRIGSSYLRPGIGFGGSCLPKELANVARMGRQAGLRLTTVEGAQADNRDRPARAVDRVERLLGGLRGRRVAVLGLSFKPGTDDIRDSPALALVLELLERGARVRAHDPAVPRTATDHVRSLERVMNPSDAMRGADLVILATEWPSYRHLGWRGLAEIVRQPILFDTRAMLDRTVLAAAGWMVIQVGIQDPKVGLAGHLAPKTQLSMSRLASAALPAARP